MSTDNNEAKINRDYVLAIDVGNTNIKIGLFCNNVLVASWRMGTDIRRTADETATVINQLFASSSIDTSRIKGSVMSSVIPQLNYTMQHALEYYFNLRPIVVEVGIKTGLSIKYENPKELGSDRIIDCVAALKKYGAPFILVDFGTATTYNVVNGKGEFIGGCITAGIKMSIEALANSTAQLPMVELVRQQKLVATSTIKGLQAGIIYGKSGEAEYILRCIKEEIGDNNIKVIATGGLAQLIIQQQPIFDIMDRELSLEGLNIIYNLNTINRKETRDY